MERTKIAVEMGRYTVVLIEVREKIKELLNFRSQVIKLVSLKSVTKI